MRAVQGLVLSASVAAVGAVMNAGGVPYSISNPAPTGHYSTEFAQESPEYFDSYAKVETRYSQVYWTRSGNIALPQEIIERFAGKVMAITGYEVDQVENPHVLNGTCLTDLCKKSDKSIPIYNAYNHHYFGWLMGNSSEMYKLDEPTAGQNPTYWAVRDTKDKDHPFPSNIVFKENPGGEYRKSYHGYPHGYAQLLHSPRNFVCEPMQIDTHNRKYAATDPAGYHPSFLPKAITEHSGENLNSGLSPLIECPCSDRITRSVKNYSAILTARTCPATIGSESDCARQIAALAPLSGSVTTHNASMALGCSMRPTPAKGAGSYMAVFNTANSTRQCGDGTEEKKGPFTWLPAKNNTELACGSKTEGPCLNSKAHGCESVGGQCIWTSEQAAQEGCSAWGECEAYFCSARYELPKFAMCKKGEKCPTLCFARGAGSAAGPPAPGSVLHQKAYAEASPSEFLRGAALEALHGPALVNATVSHDGRVAEIALSGPAGAWFGVGFNAATMADQPYAIIVDGAGEVTERKLGPHRPGSLLKASVTVVSSTAADGVRTVVLSRKVAGASKDHFSLPLTPGAVPLITAVGNGPTFAYHKARTGAMLTLLATKIDTCLCAPTSTEYLTYMNTSTAAFNYNCAKQPRGDMYNGQRLADGTLQNGEKNPACDSTTYHGGLRCCHHTWFLTDLEQNSSIPAEADVYYLKWRFYFQEYKPAVPAAPAQPQLDDKRVPAVPATPASLATPASHQHLHHWVFLIDQAVNDYEEVQCADGTACEGSITAHLPAKMMGLEDTPKNFTGMQYLVMTPHCHAPSCLRQELWNRDTGELLCRSIARYGTGNEIFNEANYVAIPPCLWGFQPGLQTPPSLHPDANLTAVKYFNNTFRHMGQMAQWTGLMVYEGEPGGRPF